MYTPIRPSKLYEQIAEQIKQRILSGELRTGDRLPTENESAEQFGASRTAVREAMKTLAQQGLIDTRPGRGAMVINATAQAMRHSLELLMRVEHAGGSADLVEVREMLEPEIAALAARRATQDQMTAMQEAVRAMDASLQDPEAARQAMGAHLRQVRQDAGMAPAS